MKKKSKRFKRDCPTCKNVIEYKSESWMKIASKRESRCNSCTSSGVNNSRYKHGLMVGDGRNKPCPDCGTKILIRSRYCKSCSKKGSRNNFYGKTHSQDVIDKIVESNTGRNCKASTKEKHRVNMVNKLKRLHPGFPKGAPMYNVDSIKILESKAKELGITDLQHAENGGEFEILGYFVDGYSSEKNVVIEYYEKFHKYQKETDMIRQQAIVDNLGCKFIIINQ
jgi:hypothetical protein